MLDIHVNDEGALERMGATGTLVDMVAGLSTAITFANVILSEISPQVSRDFREMILRCVNGPDMWDAEQMRPHVARSVCALNLLIPEENEKGEERNDSGV